MQSLQNLKNQAIYFSSPANFNDPYDCALSPRIKEPSDTDIERIRSHYLAKPDVQTHTRLEFEQASPALLRQMLLSRGRELLDEFIEKFRSRRGVSCFSEKNNNLLMWSHYGDHCKGFCLEFSTSVEPFQKIFQVHYTQEMPEIDIVPMICHSKFDEVIDLCFTKGIDWAYEQEWRCIHDQAGTAYGYSREALAGVYFGPDMSFASIEIMALVLKGQNEHVPLWKGFRNKTNFSVDFNPVTYTTNLDAKRQGLLGTSGS